VARIAGSELDLLRAEGSLDAKLAAVVAGGPRGTALREIAAHRLRERGVVHHGAVDVHP
jgi:hypothetical protein